MKRETRDAINELIELIEETEYHVSSVEALEYLNGAGFDPDDIMGTEVKLTVMIPGDETENEDNPYKVK